MNPLPVSTDRAGTQPVSAPIVGQFYWVSFVNVHKESHIGKILWRPIIGPLHEDAEHIRFPHQHWHVDWRFASENYHRMCQGQWNDPTRVHMYVCTLFRDSNNPNPRNPITEIVRRYVKCRRVMPPYPDKGAPWLPDLEKAYASAKMKCMRCPHRNMPLDPRMAKDGIITCQAHGLRWNLKTGALAPTP